ncbi:hypothetical protein FB451DRAFT_1393244 [Mycena latifolia]|nr:hypothetical protein FB451DRAFT_1393244 [Mycena latifolia]
MAAMRAKGATRIFALWTPSFSPDAAEMFPLKWWLGKRRLGIGKAVAATNDLDWTVFRVPHLTEAAADLPVAVGLIGQDFKRGFNLSRASIAVWIL